MKASVVHLSLDMLMAYLRVVGGFVSLVSGGELVGVTSVPKSGRSSSDLKQRHNVHDK